MHDPFNLNLEALEEDSSEPSDEKSSNRSIAEYAEVQAILGGSFKANEKAPSRNYRKKLEAGAEKVQVNKNDKRF